MGKQLKLALNTGYWAGGPPAGAAESIVEAERLRRERQPYLLNFVRHLVEKPN